MSQSFQRIGALSTVEEFIEHLEELGIELPCDRHLLSAREGSSLGDPLLVGDFRVGNRWCIHPMEGWDATLDGLPTERLLQRWRHFGASGAKLIWGGEALAVRPQGRANPNQLYHRPDEPEAMPTLYRELVDAHVDSFGAGAEADLLVGLQLTHSGRFCRATKDAPPEPKIAYHHPLLDAKFGIDPEDDSVLLADEEVPSLIEAYVATARSAREAGFRFVDVKACHGYLLHEFLSAYDRPGPYGGSFENRTRLLREILEAVRAACPDLLLGVRLSMFDFPPFQPEPQPSDSVGPGVPQSFPTPYPAFGCHRHEPTEINLSEATHLIRMLRDAWDVAIVNLTAGSPYYNPHIQRPALFPPSDSYRPPEDPLIGCARQIHAARELRRLVPGIPMVGTAYTYLQDYLPNVAQAMLREDWIDSVGIGRMVLAYWKMPADVLAGCPVRRNRICRTFSDCTTAPRNGLPSGCYPLDPDYRQSPEAIELKQIKAVVRAGSTTANK